MDRPIQHSRDKSKTNGLKRGGKSFDSKMIGLIDQSLHPLRACTTFFLLNYSKQGG